MKGTQAPLFPVGRWERLTRFLFPQEGGWWLTILRAGVGLEVLLYVFWLWADWNHLFARDTEGGVTRGLAEALLIWESPFIPRLGWLVEMGSGFGINEGVTLFSIRVVLLLTGVCLVLGLFSRAAAVTAWFLHLCAAKSGGLVGYGVDNLMTTGLFYLMVSPLPGAWAIERKIWARKAPHPRSLGFFRRVLQLHLCLIYFFSGLAKSLGRGWWNGENIWRALTRPPFDVLSPELIASWHLLLPIASISVCVIELGYPFFIWPGRTRRVWLALTCLLHLSTGLAMGLHLFALSMIVLNLAAFAPTPASAEQESEEEIAPGLTPA